MIATRFAFAFALLLASYSALALEFPFVPDARMTTGSMCDTSNPDFTEYRYPEQIAYCGRNVASSTKRAIYNAYGVGEECRGQYTIDHFVPLSLGGTNEVNNLWPEHKSIKALRQNLEEEMYQRLARGMVTQAQAVQWVIRAKWNPPVGGNPNPSGICR